MTVLNELISGGSPGTHTESRQDSVTPEEAAEQQAAALLNRLSCRAWVEDATQVLGYWPDLYGPELQAAVSLIGEGVVLRSLLDDQVNEEYKVRMVPLRSPGEPLWHWLAVTAPGAYSDAEESAVASVE